MKRKTPKFNKEKAKNVILYLLNRCGKMSKKKLVNLLYFCEFDFFEKHEEELCEFTFIKGEENFEIKELSKLLIEMIHKKEIDFTPIKI